MNNNTQVPIKKSNRDNFSQLTIQRLRERVANRCSNPNCRVPTSAPGIKNPDSITNIGNAAHMAAASKGGPRYDETMTQEERKSILNAIWLCANCATKIDSDEDRYPISLLKEWKRIAEEKATFELGEQLADHDDVQNQLASIFGNTPRNIKRNSISNVHNTNEDFLNRIDPRFKVITSYDGKNTAYTINAIKNTPLNINFFQDEFGTLLNSVSDIVDHGQDKLLSNIVLSITGSPILEELGISNKLNGSLRLINTLKKDALMHFSLFNHKTREIKFICGVPGFMSGGKKSVSFSGSCFGDLLTISFQCPFGENRSSNGEFFIECNFDKWSGYDIKKLPYINKLMDLFCHLNDEWQIDFNVEIDGEVKIRSRFSMDKESMLNQFNLLSYYSKASFIAKHLDKSIEFKIMDSIEYSCFKKVSEVFEIINNKFTTITNLHITESVYIQDDDCILRLKESIGSIYEVNLDLPSENLILFDVIVNLPNLFVSIDKFTPIINVELSDLSIGNTVIVKWVAVDGYKCSCCYNLDVS